MTEAEIDEIASFCAGMEDDAIMFRVREVARLLATIAAMTRERDAYRRAKAENDERYILEGCTSVSCLVGPMASVCPRCDGRGWNFTQPGNVRDACVDCRAIEAERASRGPTERLECGR